MANHPNAAKSEIPEAQRAGWRLTTALDAKLAELRERGLEVQWIEASLDDLTRLVVEGGQDAIRLDPDKSLDRAWFGDVEIRHGGSQPNTWVYVKGEVAAGDVSAHVVEPPH